MFRSTLNYECTLGGYNSNTYARAQSTASSGIQYMFVSCTGYRDNGASVGTKTASNSAGT